MCDPHVLRTTFLVQKSVTPTPFRPCWEGGLKRSPQISAQKCFISKATHYSSLTCNHVYRECGISTPKICMLKGFSSQLSHHAEENHILSVVKFCLINVSSNPCLARNLQKSFVLIRIYHWILEFYSNFAIFYLNLHIKTFQLSLSRHK